MPDNTITLVGNLTKDPEQRFTNSGLAQCTFRMAVNRRKQNQQGGWDDQTSFFNVVCWRDLAENVSASLAKGSRVVVTGRLEERSYEVEGGDKRYVIEVIADDIGASLRWATAEVTKVERREGGFAGGGGGQGGQPRSGGYDNGGSGGGQQPRPQQQPAYTNGGYNSSDEEPF
jgi:single-strand DNA-binding protein